MSASEDYDLENHHSSSLEDVCDRLDNIETAVTANHWDTSWIWALVAYFAISVWVPDIWHRKARYAFEYGVGATRSSNKTNPMIVTGSQRHSGPSFVTTTSKSERFHDRMLKLEGQNFPTTRGKLGHTGQ
jgi:hypothetical protein